MPGTNTCRTSRIVIRRPVPSSSRFHTTLTTIMRQNATRTPGDSARFTSVELSEKATTRPTTASTPNAFALRRIRGDAAVVVMTPTAAYAAAPGGSASAIAFPSGSGTFAWRTPLE